MIEIFQFGFCLLKTVFKQMMEPEKTETKIINSHRIVCSNVDPTLIADQRNFKSKYFQKGEKTELKTTSPSCYLL